MTTQLFADRRDAGRRLAGALRGLAGESPVILALPRGGVPVAAEVARLLDAPLDLFFAHKIGAPGNPEFAIAAVAEGRRPVLEIDEAALHDTGTTAADVQRQVPAELARFERQRRLYLGDRPSIPLAGRTVVLVDDGIATGRTVRAALRALRARLPGRIVLAVPVAPSSTCAALAGSVDELVCLHQPAILHAVGAFYQDFEQVGDDAVRADLDAADARVRRAGARKL